MIVYAPQKNRLVAERHSGVRKLPQSPARRVSHLVGMVEVGVEVERVVLLQHVHKLVVYSHGSHDGHSGADSYYFDVIYRPYLGYYPF